jgi:hypothetical protein
MDRVTKDIQIMYIPRRPYNEEVDMPEPRLVACRQRTRSCSIHKRPDAADVVGDGTPYGVQFRQPLYTAGSISSYAASATHPDIIYTLYIATEVSKYAEEKSMVPSFDWVEKISESDENLNTEGLCARYQTEYVLYNI